MLHITSSQIKIVGQIRKYICKTLYLGNEGYFQDERVMLK